MATLKVLLLFGLALSIASAQSCQCDQCNLRLSLSRPTSGRYFYIDPLGSLVTVDYSVDQNGQYTESRSFEAKIEEQAVRRIYNKIIVTLKNRVREAIEESPKDLDTNTLIEIIISQLTPEIREAVIETVGEDPVLEQLDQNELVKEILKEVRSLITVSIKKRNETIQLPVQTQRPVLVQTQRPVPVQVSTVVEGTSSPVDENELIRRITAQLRPMITAAIQRINTEQDSQTPRPNLPSNVIAIVPPFNTEKVNTVVPSQVQELVGDQSFVDTITIDLVPEVEQTVDEFVVDSSDIEENKEDLIQSILNQLEGKIRVVIRQSLENRGIEVSQPQQIFFSSSTIQELERKIKSLLRIRINRLLNRIRIFYQFQGSNYVDDVTDFLRNDIERIVSTVSASNPSSNYVVSETLRRLQPQIRNKVIDIIELRFSNVPENFYESKEFSELIDQIEIALEAFIRSVLQSQVQRKNTLNEVIQSVSEEVQDDIEEVFYNNVNVLIQQPESSRVNTIINQLRPRIRTIVMRELAGNPNVNEDTVIKEVLGIIQPRIREELRKISIILSITDQVVNDIQPTIGSSVSSFISSIGGQGSRESIIRGVSSDLRNSILITIRTLINSSVLKNSSSVEQTIVDLIMNRIRLIISDEVSSQLVQTSKTTTEKTVSNLRRIFGPSGMKGNRVSVETPNYAFAYQTD